MILQLPDGSLERHITSVSHYPSSVTRPLLHYPFSAFEMLTNTVRAASLAFLLATGLVLTSPVRTRTAYEVKDSHNVPSKWSNIGYAPPNTVINLHIGLRQSKFDELERHLYEGKRQILLVPTNTFEPS